MIWIQKEEADKATILEMVKTPASGCVVEFLGQSGTTARASR